MDSRDHFASRFRTHRNRGAGQGGFTLIELAVTLSVLIVVLAVAVPASRAFTLRNQASVVTAAFTSSLSFARSEAARRGTKVFIVSSAGAVSGNSHGKGWEIYADQNNDGTLDASDGAPLRRQEALPANVMLNGSTTLAFGPSGFLVPAAEANFKLCTLGTSADGRLIAVPASGIADVSSFVITSVAADC
jgi:type IV fimbrial biogenesis protein FimT